MSIDLRQILCLLVLATSCGGGREALSQGEEADTAGISSGDAAEHPDPAEAAGSAAADTCRSTMRSLAGGESLYFDRVGNYSDPVGLETSGILPGAAFVSCPKNGISYIVTCSRDSYCIECPNGHGSITGDGASWE
jgi:hypothetical protein